MSYSLAEGEPKREQVLLFELSWLFRLRRNGRVQCRQMPVLSAQSYLRRPVRMGRADFGAGRDSRCHGNRLCARFCVIPRSPITVGHVDRRLDFFLVGLPVDSRPAANRVLRLLSFAECRAAGRAHRRTNSWIEVSGPSRATARRTSRKRSLHPVHRALNAESKRREAFATQVKSAREVRPDRRKTASVRCVEFRP